MLLKTTSRGVNAQIPLHALTSVTGVSGSGKSTLINEVMIPLCCVKPWTDSEQRHLHYGSIGGSISKIGAMEFVDQNPIGKELAQQPCDVCQSLR